MTAADSVVRFDLVTEETGLRHTIDVEVWPSRPAMLQHLTDVFPEGNWGDVNAVGEAPSAGFISVGDFNTLDAPDTLGTVYYCTDFLDIGTVVHEIVHAAMFIYFVDVVGTYSRAIAHMNAANEMIAYLIDGLMSQLAHHLLANGLYSNPAEAAAA